MTLLLSLHHLRRGGSSSSSLFVISQIVVLLQILLIHHDKISPINAFTPARHHVVSRNSRSSHFSFRRQNNRPVSSIMNAIKNDDYDDDDSNNKITSSFDPLDIPSDVWDNNNKFTFDIPSLHHHPHTPLPTAAATLATLTLLPTTATAAPTVDFNPQNFQPICPASDSIYRLLRSAAVSLVGQDNMSEYGPIVAGGLLRIRLELCVVESFFSEAVGPFVKEKGLSWVLPLHETVETFAAGTIFAFTTTFILVGSTKIASVLTTFLDVFVGAPCRTLGGFIYDRSRGVPITFDVGLGPWKKRVVGPEEWEWEKMKKEGVGGMMPEDMNLVSLIFVVFFGGAKALGETLKVLQEVVEGFDLFVGRYLLTFATGYVGLKYLHFKVFPDFPDFELLLSPPSLPSLSLPTIPDISSSVPDLPSLSLPTIPDISSSVPDLSNIPVPDLSSLPDVPGI